LVKKITYCKIHVTLISSKRGFGSGGIRTHAPEETGALNQRLRPLGHATLLKMARERKVKVEHCLLRGLNSRPLVYKTSALPLS
jgi:hypothetical protein